MEGAMDTTGAADLPLGDGDSLRQRVQALEDRVVALEADVLRARSAAAGQAPSVLDTRAARSLAPPPRPASPMAHAAPPASGWGVRLQADPPDARQAIAGWGNAAAATSAKIPRPPRLTFHEL